MAFNPADDPHFALFADGNPTTTYGTDCVNKNDLLIL